MKKFLIAALLAVFMLGIAQSCDKDKSDIELYQGGHDEEPDRDS